jgi:hypothetical protein
MSAKPEDLPLHQAPIDKPPRAKRVMTEAQVENLKRAREKALATRQDKKLLLEREDLLKKEVLEARWEALHKEEERIKAMRKAPSSAPEPKQKKPAAIKSKILHVSPPLSSEPSSPEPSSDSSMEFVPKSSRRAHRISQQHQKGEEAPRELVHQSQQPPPPQPPQQDEQLKIALRALGLSSGR